MELQVGQYCIYTLVMDHRYPSKNKTFTAKIIKISDTMAQIELFSGHYMAKKYVKKEYLRPLGDYNHA